LHWHRWLHTARDADGSGLVCIVHPWESGTDDSPRWLEVLRKIRPVNVPRYKRGDTAYVPSAERPHRADYEHFIYFIDALRRLRYDPAALVAKAPFLVQDVLFNSILHRADRDLRLIARELGEPTSEIEDWLKRMQASFDDRFWDETAGLYYDFDLRAGKNVRVNTAATFLPLFGGLAGAQRAQHLIEDNLLNQDEYAPAGDVRHWCTTTSRTEPSWEPRRYWRGPVWILMNWFLVEGLQGYGHTDLAETIRQDTVNLLESSGFWEYYDPRDGSGCGSPDFSWSAALAYELTAE
jgi:hypothetical protein